VQMMIKVMNEQGQLPWLPYIEKPRVIDMVIAHG
jgi:hypothetical protein